MPRKHTASFILELPLKTDPADERACTIILDAGRNIGNAVLGEGLHRLDLMGESRAYRAARKMSRGEPRSPERKAGANEFKRLFEAFGFTGHALQKFAQGCRDKCWIRDHLPGHVPKRRPRGPLMRSCNMHLASVGAPSSGVGIGTIPLKGDAGAEQRQEEIVQACALWTRWVTVRHPGRAALETIRATKESTDEIKHLLPSCRRLSRASASSLPALKAGAGRKEAAKTAWMDG
jgi:hypothetical protein